MININIRDLKTQLDTPQKIVILPHKNPDGDAMGSSLGLDFKIFRAQVINYLSK